MSLSDSLRSAIRQRIPESVLSVCEVADRIVIENILTVLAESTKININMSTLEVKPRGYCVSVPISNDMQISLLDLRQVETYSPARVLDLRIVIKNGQTATLQILVANEKSVVMVQDTDVLRITKRRRWW